MSQASEELRSRLLTLADANPEETNGRPKMPEGWKPGVVWDGTKGNVTTGALTEAPKDWRPLLVERGLDPDLYDIDGDSITWCSWDGWFRPPEGGQAVSKICYSYRATIRLKRPGADSPDLLEMYKLAQKAKPRKTVASGEATLVIALSDLQIGNGDNGGVDEQLDALAALPSQLADHLADLRRLKVPVGQICLAGLGDLIENVCGFYSDQTFTVQLDRREQMRVARRATFEICKELAPRVEKFILTGVGGNHGESSRQGGKRVTGTNDNDDVAALEAVGDQLLSNPATFGNVSVRLPAERLAISLNLSGQLVGFTHGHIAKMKSGDAIKTMWEWWRDQRFGRSYPGIADASIVICGHYHHFNVKEQLGRTLFVCPSLTNVSAYFADSKGVLSNPGTLTLVTHPDGWDNLKIVR